MIDHLVIPSSHHLVIALPNKVISDDGIAKAIDDIVEILGC
jgi:hypothetical protein